MEKKVSEEDELPPGDEDLLSPHFLTQKLISSPFQEHYKSALIGN